MDDLKYIFGKFPSELFDFDDFHLAKLGKLEIDLYGNYSFTIHISKKPKLEIRKWGLWGKNYNVIVLKYIASVKSVSVNVEITGENSPEMFLDGRELKRSQANLKFFSNDHRSCVELSITSATYQGADRYIHSEVET